MAGRKSSEELIVIAKTTPSLRDAAARPNSRRTSRRRLPRRVSASNVIAAAGPSHSKQTVFGAQPQPGGTSPYESSACAL